MACKSWCPKCAVDLTCNATRCDNACEEDSSFRTRACEFWCLTCAFVSTSTSTCPATLSPGRLACLNARLRAMRRHRWRGPASLPPIIPKHRCGECVVQVGCEAALASPSQPGRLVITPTLPIRERHRAPNVDAPLVALHHERRARWRPSPRSPQQMSHSAKCPIAQLSARVPRSWPRALPHHSCVR